MRIDPAALPNLDNPYAQTCQVNGGNSQDQVEAFESFRCRQFTGVDLIAA